MKGKTLISVKIIELTHGQPVKWDNVLINTFSIQPNQGTAVVKLVPPVVSPERLRGIESVAKDRQYVVDEIQFDSKHNTISIQATPYQLKKSSLVRSCASAHFSYQLGSNEHYAHEPIMTIFNF